MILRFSVSVTKAEPLPERCGRICLRSVHSVRSDGMHQDTGPYPRNHCITKGWKPLCCSPWLRIVRHSLYNVHCGHSQGT